MTLEKKTKKSPTDAGVAAPKAKKSRTRRMKESAEAPQIEWASV